MENGGVAYFHVSDVFGGGVFGEFVCGAGQSIFRLENGEGDVETAQVFVQAFAGFGAADDFPEFFFGRGREFDFLFLCQIEDRADAERAVQMHVQVGFRQFLYEFFLHEFLL